MKLIKRKRAVADKLKLVFHANDVAGANAEYITRVLDDYVQQELATTLSVQQKAYANRYRVPLDEEGSALFIEVNANQPERNPMALTFEWTPSHLKLAGRNKLRTVVPEILGTQSSRILTNALVYNLDIAIDFPVDIQDVAIELEGKSVCGVWGKSWGKGPHLQTLYFGSSASDHHATAYDKLAELHSQLSSSPPTADKTTTLKRLVDRATLQGPRLRLEDRVRLGRCPVPLHRLDAVRDPFAGFHVYAFAEAEARASNNWQRLTIALAKAVGLAAAAKHLTKSERETMRKLLAKCQVEWWDAAKYRSAVTDVLKDLRLFPDAAFDTATRSSSECETLYQERLARKTQRGKSSTVTGLSKADEDFRGLEDDEEYDE